ncbi:MAG: hypothetical protein A2538_03325 [Candidatus Magasanikbacteria bacterium RIFOXYD2_FULL_41_14]|uniref:Uncharacterized protein n=1 Tax=Candidatus Magasanikbacteria bacterium RIFOXYD2_FULL_41_14 TaxID=1798709 RepID=A0A1F6PCG4_9BACT|nr:MAG: hypothetical protein A2538_03325 [Candidatus Magasanikbacteria bacterium RIFOXYD2_FULL_41_14]
MICQFGGLASGNLTIGQLIFFKNGSYFVVKPYDVKTIRVFEKNFHGRRCASPTKFLPKIRIVLIWYDPRGSNPSLTAVRPP